MVGVVAVVVVKHKRLKSTSSVKVSPAGTAVLGTVAPGAVAHTQRGHTPVTGQAMAEGLFWPHTLDERTPISWRNVLPLTGVYTNGGGSGSMVMYRVAPYSISRLNPAGFSGGGAFYINQEKQKKKSVGGLKRKTTKEKKTKT